MNPSSGARSGTTPSRPKPAGDGRLARGALLACGHRTYAEPVAVFSDGDRLYRCPDGCSQLMRRADA